jgi:hypothetical protein
MTAHHSDDGFRVLHALRVKGFASVETLVDLSGVAAHAAESMLHSLRERELTAFREARGLWQLTGAGKDHHREQLAAETAAASAMVGALQEQYEPFLELNVAFKELCGRWQLRDGEPNDHTDAKHDKAVVKELMALDKSAQPIVVAFSTSMIRYTPYAPRLAASAKRVAGGDTKMFTGVMCGSYHDVWMELHEDLILTLGVDRSAEGSF